MSVSSVQVAFIVAHGNLVYALRNVCVRMCIS